MLDDDGRRSASWAGTFAGRGADRGLRNMMLVRSFDARLLRAHRQGKISFYMQCLGEEAIACAQQRALRPGDMHFPTYRQQGLLDRGRLSDRRHDEPGPVEHARPAQGPPAPGDVLVEGARLLLDLGQPRHAVHPGGRLGDGVGDARRHRRSRRRGSAKGATAESDFHAALVFASTYQAPVILNIVNNHWAISTPEDFARGASATFADRGFGFSIPALRVDGNDYLAVLRGVAVGGGAGAQRNLGPTLIEWVTLRVGAHSTSDDPSVYRPDDEPSTFPLGDPIDRLRRHLVVDRATGTTSATQAFAAEVDARGRRRVRRGRLARLREGRRDHRARRRCSTTCSRRCRGTSANSASRWAC